jgi:hypothetical protein
VPPFWMASAPEWVEAEAAVEARAGAMAIARAASGINQRRGDIQGSSGCCLCADARYPNINLPGYFVIDVFLSKLFGTCRYQAKPAEFNSPGVPHGPARRHSRVQTASVEERGIRECEPGLRSRALEQVFVVSA